MAAAEVAVDFGYLSTHLGVPENTLETAAAQPTADLVRAVLQAVAAKAHEFDNLYAEKLHVDIELENAVRSADSRCQSFKATADKALKDAEELRKKLQQEESTRQGLESELQQLQSSSGGSLSEIENLNARIKSLEQSNRDTVAAVDAKNAANSELLTDLQKLQQKNHDLSKQVAELQQSVQAEKAAANSAKWREQNLEQEVALLKRNNDSFEQELKTKREEALKYRKEKGARIAELERLTDEQRSTIDSLTRGEQQLRSRLDDAQRKADDSLAKIQQLKEAAARTEESFTQELEASRRLADLQVQQAETSRGRLREVENRLEKVQDDFAVQRMRIEKQLEDEKAQHQKSFERAQELEQEISRLQAAGPPQSQFALGSRPSTPVANGHLRAGSPFGTPGSIRGKNMTQAIDELWKVKSELINVKKRNQQLVQELDETMSVLEAKAPEFNGLEAEIEKLRSENIQMTQLADESFQERDLAKKAARKAESSLGTAQSEANILRAQLRDLGVQIQLLVFNLQAQEKGLDQLTQEEVVKFDQLQRGEVAPGALDDLSDTHRFITEKFVAFKDIHELQSKNEELLRITRELADKMESDEAQAAKQQAVDNENELVSLRETCARLQDEIKSMTVRMKSHMQERDMFRRMAEGQRTRVSDVNDAEGAQREVLASIEQSSNVDEGEAMAIRELQASLDSQKDEFNTDRKAMREHIDRLSAEKSSLQSEVVRIRSQLELASERYAMLQGNCEALQNEKSELQKRSQSLSEAAAKHDLRSQQLASDLVETKALLDSVQSKTSNLEAEKALFTSIRDRLLKDNEELSKDKATLSTLLTQNQTLLNEKDTSDKETRRSLNEQIQSLKTELTSKQRNLDNEIEESRRLQQRKDYEAQQHQQRLDELLSSLNMAKEELVATKTSRDHLQARVDELTIELRNAQEKAERLQPRPTPRPGTAVEPRSADAETEAQIDELVNEISDLKRDLDLATTHLESSRSQTEQYKEIAQAAEEELTQNNAIQEQYREQMDAELVAKDAQIKELQQRVDNISVELSNSNNELSSIRDSQTEATRKSEEEKRILEDEITRLKEEAERLKERAKYHQQDLRAQADIAKKAQQDYETELFKHAEAAKALQALRSQHNQLKTNSASLKAEAESAKHTLDDNKRSFAEREQQLKQEISDLKERRQETDQQNKLLQEQLHSFTSQIAAIKENRTAFIEATDDTINSAPGSDVERLTELNKYLHREKEILEVQYNLKNREAERLQQQVDAKQSQLEEYQLKLEQERVARNDTSTTKSHEELMNKLNELNLIRESNSTLRSENKRIERQLEQRSTKIKELEATIEPLKARISELEGSKEFLEEELKQLGEDRDHWQKRVESIVTKHGRVDPAELEQMKEKASELEAERDALKQAEEPLKARITELETTLETEKSSWTAARGKIIEQAKNKNRENSTKIAELNAEKAQLQAQLDETSQRLTSLQSELDSAVQEKSTLGQEKYALEQKLSDVQQQLEAASTVTQEPPAQISSDAVSSEQLLQAQQQLESAQQQLAAANEAKTAADQELQRLRSDLAAITQDRDAARAQVGSQAPAEAVPQPETAPQADAEVTQDSGVTEAQPAPSAASDAERAELEQKLARAEQRVTELEAEVAELTSKMSEYESNQKAIVDARSQKMKEALNKKLAEDKAKNLAELTKEKEKLQGEYDLKLSQERAIWEAENKVTSAPAAVADSVAATPTKQTDQQQPQTPNPNLPSLLVANFLQLNDADTRKVVSENSTIKSIITSNLKKKVEIETKKVKDETEQALKTEHEAKITAAKEQATFMASKKSTLRINMAENKLKGAVAKLTVVETAAKETPERAVGEVWEEAKNAKVQPGPEATVKPASSPAPTDKAVAAAGAGTLDLLSLSARKTSKANVVSGTPATPTSESKPPPANGAIPPKPVPAAATAQPVAAQPNPFASGIPPKPTTAAANPFASAQPSSLPANPTQAASQHPPVQGQQNQAQPQGQQGQQPAKTGIPVAARGGAPRGGRGGTYQLPRGGSRGGYQNRNASGAGQPNLNPGAENFQPGNKRPRDAEAGGPAAQNKRPRGGGPHRGGAA
ncbi:Protein mlp1 [Diaporthe australafricana]|uniref:Protein mlp1 n=1 Tax=Diaporthe australafricana TaxID=127596 RepID=A0ABR3X7H1_9PEZI